MSSHQLTPAATDRPHDHSAPNGHSPAMHSQSQPSSAHHPPQPPQAPANQPSPTKRKPSETAAETDSTNGNNSKKQKRRKVNHACVYCRRSHMTCDLERPCTRCVKRDIGHLCHDEPREGPKRTKSDGGAVSGADVGGVAIAPAPTEEPERSGGGMMGAQMDGGAGATVASGMQFTGQGAGGMSGGNGINGTSNPVTAGQQGLPQPDQLSPAQLQRQQPPPPPPPAANVASGAPQTTNPANLQMNNFDWNNSGNNNNNSWNQFQDMHHLHPNYMFNTSEVTNEYNLLNDFLSSSLLDDGAMYSTDEAQTLFNDPLLSTSSINALSQNFGQQTPNQQPQPQNRPPSQQQQIQPQHLQQSPHHQQHQQPLQPSNQPTQHHHQQQKPHHPPQPPQPPPPKPGEPNPTPSSSDPNKARNNYFLTAADPAGLTSASDRLHKLLRAKYDAGMLKPFNYVRGYARLQSYMSRHLLPSSQRRILSQLSRFRPKFREAMQELTDMQLVLVEMWFERSLMEYDRVFASMAIPACCWRRTGEIFRGNREMAELIGVGMESLRDGRLAIHEVLEEESLVSYWEKFGAIAFDGSQKAILTSCSVKVPGEGGDGGGGGNEQAGGSGSARREGGFQLQQGQQGQQGPQQQGKSGEDSRISVTTTTEVQGKNSSSSPLAANKGPDHSNSNNKSNDQTQSGKGKEPSETVPAGAAGNSANTTTGNGSGTSGTNNHHGGNGGGGGTAAVRTKKCCFSFTIRRDNHNM
ncbi:hypothetical protein D0863_16068 [Hortaea werneckii]|uniref:Zn(2)-C6 fungal-type domain-containing protein n=1 Tax=Hortaea werneckii TaxID=91943 RepID=A0A3M7C0H8_HORWE|nr:hypothetical protein D0863_16068 [Hortaea werneckii]